MQAFGSQIIKLTMNLLFTNAVCGFSDGFTRHKTINLTMDQLFAKYVVYDFQIIRPLIATNVTMNLLFTNTLYLISRSLGLA